MTPERLEQALVAAFGNSRNARYSVAPGRVNLVGEHTDYNDGFVLPMAIDRYVGAAYRARDDRTVRVRAVNLSEERALDLDRIAPGRVAGWTAYVAGVLWALQRAGFTLRGFDIAILGDIPIGAGLSSSAALELAVARAACDVCEIEWDAARMAFLGQEVERDFIGVPCGIMDQFAVALSREGCALLLDCRTLETQPVPIPPGAAVVVMDTGVRRMLERSAYGERVEQCAAAVAILRKADPHVRALRDVTPSLLADLRGHLDPVLYRRTKHVVHENLRPIAMAGALRTGDPVAAGQLMRESHRSLRDLFEVSSAELDAIVSIAEAHPACHGARLTGAGFGGCAVALVQRSGVDDFVLRVRAGYRERFAHPVVLYPCEPSAGARVLGDPLVPASPAT